MDEDLFFAGVAGQAGAVRAGTVSAVELTEAVLERIQRLDGRLNAFTTVTGEQALADAKACDAACAGGPLHGVPVAVKEELDVRGSVTTFGGRANTTPALADSLVVRRLREAGAVVVGKTNMPEFGQWPFTESAAHGMTRNPWDLRRSPGGSSGGSAAAVAAGLVAVAIGGDGGGSIRIPAACCGLFGLKPQRGRVSAAPLPHLWWALGTTGPLTRSVLDSAIVYDVIRGGAAGDRYAAEKVTGSFAGAARAAGPRLRIGWSTRSATPGLRAAAEHVTAVQRTAEVLAGLGHQVREVDPGYPTPVADFLPQFFGGIRAEAQSVELPHRLERRTRETLRLGAWARVPVVERAVSHARLTAVRANRVFEQCDVLLTPTIAQRPPETGVLDGVGTVRAMLRALPMVAYTALWNVTGNPAASVPAGFAEDGLPVAVQLVGPPDGEPALLTLAAELEHARPWTDARPSL